MKDFACWFFHTSDKLTWRRFLAIGFIQRVKIPFWKLRWTFSDRFSSTKNHRGFPQRRVTADLKVNFKLKHFKKHFDHLNYSVWMAFTFTFWLLCCEVTWQDWLKTLNNLCLIFFKIFFKRFVDIFLDTILLYVVLEKLHRFFNF